MVITIDRNIYSDACISKVVYWLSGKYEISRQLEDNKDVITFHGENINEDELRTLIYQLLNDYKLRELIETETHDIRTILYAKAFAECDDLEE